MARYPRAFAPPLNVSVRRNTSFARPAVSGPWCHVPPLEGDPHGTTTTHP